MKQYSKIKRAAALVAAITVTLGGKAFAASEPKSTDTLPVERYALYVASNDGGPGRETLKYAGTDAKRLAKTMSEIGGISAKNSILLTDPSKTDIEEAFKAFRLMVSADKGKAKRTEFLFYYSGHSDEEAFLLGDETLRYSELKQDLTVVPTDVHVVMLDSCFSGNFVRAKGGSREKPFLFDDSSVVQGHAYLSSSSAHEASQESDAIQASYFTAALVSGLRGAADTSGDAKVSLNELYHYAFNETLSRTELSAVGPQHPAYNMTLVGSGDLILTDLSESESTLVLQEGLEGRFFIRNEAGQLVSEINKVKGTAMTLALPAGTYSITALTAASTLQASVRLVKGDKVPLEAAMLGSVPRTGGRARGGEQIEATEVTPLSTEEELALEAEKARERAREAAAAAKQKKAEGDAENQSDREEKTSESEPQATSERQSDSGEGEAIPFALSLWPGLSIPDHPSNVQFSLGFISENDYVHIGQVDYFMGIVGKRLRGAQVSGFMNIAKCDVQGFQVAGFMNTANGSVQGVQAAGFINIARGKVMGIQGAGFMNTSNGGQGIQGSNFLNIANGPFMGVQGTGFLNIANGDIQGVQGSGFLNVINGNLKGVQGSGFMNIANGNLEGVQASGFLNIAKKVHGVQVGVINIADDVDGVALGYLNFIKNGVMSPAIYMDSDGNAFIQYQGGVPRFYTTALAGINTNWLQSWDNTNVILGYGVGTRLQPLPMLSFDIELLDKSIYDTTGLASIAKLFGEISTLAGVVEQTGQLTQEQADTLKASAEAAVNGLYLGHIPALKATANFSLAKHFSLFVSGNLDARVYGWNDAAFSRGNHGTPISIGSGWVDLYPSWSAGLKF